MLVFNHRWIHLLRALLIVAALVPIMAWSAVNAENRPEKLVVGYQMIPNAELVAKDLGWHEEAIDVPIEWIEFDSGIHVNKAIEAGQVDIGLVGSSPCAAGIARGVPMEVVWIHDIIGDNEALVVRSGAGIEAVGGLAGKTVAAPFGSTTHYHLMVALMVHHLKSDDVNIVFKEPRDMLAAWNRGEIDAGFVWMPTLSKMRHSGGRILLTSRELVDRGFPTGDLCVVRRAFAQKHPSTVTAYLKTLDRAVRFWREKPEAAAAALARQTGLSVGEALQQMQGMILLTAKEQDEGKYFGGTHWNFGLYTVLKDTADFLKAEGVIENLPPRIQFMNAVNASFLVHAMED